MSFDTIPAEFALPDRSRLTDSDVVAQIVFAPGRLPTGLAIDRFESALRRCYVALAGQPVGKFETVRVLHDVPSESIVIWLRLDLVPEEGPSALAPDLTFLTRGALTIMRWLAMPSPQFADLSRAIQVLVDGTLPAEGAMSPQPDIVSAVASLQNLQGSIPNAEKVKFALHRGAAELSLAKAPVNLDVSNRKTILNGSGDMILIVERPDYSRQGCWEFRHGTEKIQAICDAGPIVEGFHRRSVDIRPGDALRCRVRVERSYNADNMLLSEQFAVEEIVAVLADGFAGPPSAIEISPATPFKVDRDYGDDRIIERIEGDFGTLTLREIPVN